MVPVATRGTSKIWKRFRMMSGLKSKTYAEKCAEVSLNTLEVRRTFQDIVQTSKILHNVDNVDPEKLFNKIRDRKVARTRLAADLMNLRSVDARLDVRKHSFLARVLNMEQSTSRD